ncbi:MAG: OmpH family outer membrane protein [Novosphingobium sp.]
MKLHLLAGLAGLSLIALSGPVMAAAPAPAARKAALIPGLGVVNGAAAIQASKSYAAAISERQSTFKQQLDAAEARRLQINAQLQPLIEKYNRESQAGKSSQAALQAQLTAIQNLQQSGQRELQGMLEPVSRSDAYVQEQFAGIINKAIADAMTKRGITFVVPPQDGYFYDNGYSLDAAVAQEIDALLPTVKVVPPADWKPGAQQVQ